MGRMLGVLVVCLACFTTATFASCGDGDESMLIAICTGADGYKYQYKRYNKGPGQDAAYEQQEANRLCGSGPGDYELLTYRVACASTKGFCNSVGAGEDRMEVALIQCKNDVEADFINCPVKIPQSELRALDVGGYWTFLSTGQGNRPDKWFQAKCNGNNVNGNKINDEVAQVFLMCPPKDPFTHLYARYQNGKWDPNFKCDTHPNC